MGHTAAKISRGQKKLILASVRALTGGNVPRQDGANRGNQTNRADVMRAHREEITPTNQSAALGASHGASHDLENGDAHEHQTTDGYVQGLLSQLVRGQLQAQTGLSSVLNTGSISSSARTGVLGGTPSVSGGNRP